MDKEHLKATLWDLDMTASLNDHYYHCLAVAFAIADRLVRIAVGVVGVIAFAYSGNQDLSWGIGLAMLIVAVILNATPLHAWETHCRTLQTKWSDLRSDVQEFEIDVFGAVINAAYFVRCKGQHTDPLSKQFQEQAARLVYKRHQLNADDFLRWPWLVDWHWVRERQRRYGKTVKTRDDEAAAVERLKEQPTTTPNAAAC
jgi:hypothetical protein